MERPNFCKRVCLWDVMFVSVDGHVTRQKKKSLSMSHATPCYMTKVFVYISCGFYDFHKARLLSPHAVSHQVHLWNLLKKKHLCSWRRKGFFFCILFPPPPPCSQCVPLRNIHQVLKVVPQDIPNSTLDLSHMVCPKFNSHVYKLKR